MTERFVGQVALVTGGTRGIGAAIVRRLVSEGARVAFCGRTDQAGAALVQELGEDRAMYLHADLGNPADCATTVDRTIERWGRLDILVNNAASVARGTLSSTTVEAWDALFNINLRAPFLLMQRALPTFQAQHARHGTGGVVINIGSINAYVGGKNVMAYSASKGGLNTLSRNLANALQEWRIRVHVLNVGWTLTEGEEVVQRHEGAGDDWVDRASATRPAGRLLDPNEIAATVAFFASNEAAIFSGAAVELEQFPIVGQ